MAQPDTTSAFTFHALEQGFKSLSSREAQDALHKWNLGPFMRTQTFRFDQRFSTEQLDGFLSDFFGDPNVQAALPVCTAPGAWGQLGPVKQSAVRYQTLRATVLRLDFFDRLNAAGVVRSGSIAKCFDVQCGDILVSDLLRKMLLDEESEEWDLFSPTERSELIFHVLRRLAIGGGMNQFDDGMETYLSLTKALYKDLVTVQKSSSGALQIASHIVQVTGIVGNQLFPRESPHNFCYVSIDPFARQVKCWYGAWFAIM
ncbi:hypothetical protein AB1Y20_004028 [Prymnesium parvum]|uniref:Cilia- and flagella-associated protein 300 n=1 Tax=Prymnesium parvum TaxID=97485 RepID=A0AB34J9E4_PRYPA